MKLAYRFSDAIRRTHLHDFHKNGLKAKMTHFAGYDMPVSYPQGVLKEHLQVRERVGLFDVSHMGQVKFYGPDHLKLTELVTTGDIQARKPGESHLCLILNEQAGIIDDTIVTRRDDHVHLVLNAGNKFIDLDHIARLQKQHNLNVDVKYLEDKPLIAIQGPHASALISELIDPSLAKLPFMNMTVITKNGVEYQVNRCGYTGEDGYEVSVDAKHAVEFAERLLGTSQTFFCGLGARDSLRIEAGLCLHGHEVDETISPVEARLMWTVREKRDGVLDYHGFEALQRRQQNSTTKRCGFIANEGIIRPPLDIIDENGEKVGYVTSGTYSPVLKKGIGMGYVKSKLNKSGVKLHVVQRGKTQGIIIAKTPFVPNRYFK